MAKIHNLNNSINQRPNGVLKKDRVSVYKLKTLECRFLKLKALKCRFVNWFCEWIGGGGGGE